MVKIIFDRKKLIAHKNRAAKKIADYDFLYNIAAENIIDKLEDVQRDFSSIIIYGAVNKNLFNYVQKRFPESLIVNADISEKNFAKNKFNNSVLYDEERIPFNNNSFDLILSTLSLHWINDIVGTLIQYNNALKPNGMFIGNLIGEESLKELRDSLTQAELSEKSGATPRISPFIDIKTIASLMQRSNFDMPISDVDKIGVSYPNFTKLAHDLRFMGQNNALSHKFIALNKKLIKTIDNNLKIAYPEEDGRFKVNFEIINISALAKRKSA